MTSSSALSLSSRLPLSNGLSIPRLGLGTWRSDKGLVSAAVKSSLLNGYRHLDCAWIYLNEEEVGEGLRDAQKENKDITRESIFITSKVWNDSHTAEGLESNINETLKNLGTSYVDLLLVHWPVHWKKFSSPWGKDANGVRQFDSSVTMESLWRLMEKTVTDGKAKSIGLSNFDLKECEEILKIAKIRPVVNQIEIHPYWNQKAFIGKMKQLGMEVEAYCPLAQLGRKEGELHYGVTALEDPVIKDLATKYKKSPAQIIIRWHLQSGVIVIPKSTNPKRIVENSQVFDFELSNEDILLIDSLGKRNIRFVNPDFRPEGKKIFDEQEDEKLSKF